MISPHFQQATAPTQPAVTQERQFTPAEIAVLRRNLEITRGIADAYSQLCQLGRIRNQHPTPRLR